MTPEARRSLIASRLLILCMQDAGETTPEDDALMDALRAETCNPDKVAVARAEREEIDETLRNLESLAALVYNEMRRFGIVARVEIERPETGITDDARERYQRIGKWSNMLIWIRATAQNPTATVVWGWGEKSVMTGAELRAGLLRLMHLETPS